MKLDPQTVIGVENALPRIIMALILITFSFPIAGFLIDLMYIITAIIISLVAPIGGFGTDALQAKYLQANPADIFSIISGAKTGFFSIDNIFWNIPNAFFGMFGIVGKLVQFLGGFLGFLFILPALVEILRSIGSLLNIRFLAQIVVGFDTGDGLKGLTETLGWPVVISLSFVLGGVLLIPIIIGTAILLTIIFLFFRILFILLSSYIKIFLYIILSPLILMFEAIPGRSTFSNWIKGLITELLTFPLLIGILLLSSIIISSDASGDYIRFPFLFGVDANSLRFLIGMSFLFMTPDLIMLVKQLLMPKPLPIPDAGPGVFFSGATTGLNAGISEFSKWSSLGMYNPAVGRILSKIPGFKEVGKPH
jgi:hypothetical protein